MKLPDYSVLMSVYKNEKAEYLRTAMNSMWNQTVVTNDFVLICDGPLTEEIDEVIKDMQLQHPDELHVIRLKQNRGLGRALRAGVLECKNELIARMDSDDISLPERFGKKEPESSRLLDAAEKKKEGRDLIRKTAISFLGMKEGGRDV